MSISKVSSGLILNDDFNNSFNPLWDIMPNDMNRVLFAENSISLLPQLDVPLEMLIPAPGGKFVMQTEIEYNPLTVNDKAGIVIKSVTDCNVEAEFTFEEGVSQDYRFIRFTNTSDYVINLRASADGANWDDLGNSKLYDGNYLGYYVNGEQAEFKLKNCLICKDKFVVIQGIRHEDKVELLNSNGADLIRAYNLDYVISGEKLLLDMTKIMWPIKDVTLAINMGKVNGSTYKLGDLYGGDVFSFEPELLFSIDGITENKNGFELGEIYGRAKAYTLRVFNNGMQHKSGKLVIDPVSSYEQGHNMAYIHSLDSDFTDKSKELEISVAPGQEFSCIVRIVKESKFVAIDGDFNFNIVFMQ